MAMDHALSRFNRLNRSGGIILSLDADTLCQENYLSVVEQISREYPDMKACNIHFEHPLQGTDFPESVYNGIIQYELHLRYYVEGLRFAGHPHAYHTVGSAFGVRAGIYAAQGGMNRRKAGEDFYFLQKIIPLGGFYEIHSTRVFPSPRPSDRVGFGTGPVMSKFERGETTQLDTFHPKVFSDLKEYLDSAGDLFEADPQDYAGFFENYPESIRQDISSEFLSRIHEIRSNSAQASTFLKRFYRWFNMFRTLKYMNHAHRHHYPRMPVTDAARIFLSGKESGLARAGAHELLIYLREAQRGH
jgi:hypothetical protein